MSAKFPRGGSKPILSHPSIEECDYHPQLRLSGYHISRDDIFDYHPNRECNIYFIIPNMRAFIFYRLRPTMMSLLSICMNENNIFLKMVVSSSLNAQTDRDFRSYKLRHKKSTTPNLIPSSAI